MLQVEIAKAAFVFWKYSNLREKHNKLTEELLELRQKNTETPSYQITSEVDEDDDYSNSYGSKRQRKHASQFLLAHS